MYVRNRRPSSLGWRRCVAQIGAFEQCYQIVHQHVGHGDQGHQGRGNKPPLIAVAMLRNCSVAGGGAMAMGNMAAPAANAVIRTGRRRSALAAMIAFRLSMPRARRLTILSTIKMELDRTMSDVSAHGTHPFPPSPQPGPRVQTHSNPITDERREA